jgi:hypothetical protein
MGAFMAGQGGDPIQQALASRGMAAPQQLSQGSPSFDPSMAPQVQGSPQAPQAPQGQPPMPQGVPQQGTSESRVIVGALKNRLELLGKMGQ